MDIRNNKVFDTRIKSETISVPERMLGYFIGPSFVMLMTSILSSYLNVYYTDVLQLGAVWGGWFISVFPIVVKLIDAFTYIIMGAVIDRFHSRQGVARPWILFSAPILSVSMILLFAVPSLSENGLAIWIFISYNLFYSVAYTAYGSAHTLMVPLSTTDRAERASLSVFTNSQAMFVGSFVAVFFPTLIIPAIGVTKRLWVLLMGGIAIIALPLVSLEYFFTRERVTEQSGKREKSKLSLIEQLKCCLKSRLWVTLMGYMVLVQLANTLSSLSTFYYCNWVLGRYNDGITQLLYYAIGNAPLGAGIFLARPICKRLGRRNAMVGGFLLAAVGTGLCWMNMRSLPLVLAGQFIKSIGLIPTTFMVTALLGDALDNVHEKSGVRCDGFSSSAFNVVATVTTGLAMAILNLGITRLGYLAPTEELIPTQPEAIQSFFGFCAAGLQTILFPIAAFVLSKSPDDRRKLSDAPNL